MTLMRWILAMLLFMVTGVLCSVTYATEKKWEEIRFGVEALVPPFESRNAAGELVGLNIELGRALCAELKVRCVWVDQDYSTNLAALEANRFDVIIPMTATPARRQKIDFTDNLYALETRLVTRKGANLSPTPAALAGKRVGVLAGTSREAYALGKWASSGVIIRSFDRNDALIASLLAGEIDATLQDSIEISEALLKTPQGTDFAFAGPGIIDEMLGSGVALGIRKTDPQLRDALNQGLQRLRENGQYLAITRRYLGSVPSTPVRETGEIVFVPAQDGLPFSESVHAGSFLFLSGLLGLDENGKRVPGGVEAETAKALENLRNILTSKGLTMDRVVKCTVILADLKDFAAMNKVYTRFFATEHLPARTTFAAAKLLLDARIEIECVASY